MEKPANSITELALLSATPKKPSMQSMYEYGEAPGTVSSSGCSTNPYAAVTDGTVTASVSAMPSAAAVPSGTVVYNKVPPNAAGVREQPHPVPSGAYARVDKSRPRRSGGCAGQITAPTAPADSANVAATVPGAPTSAITTAASEHDALMVQPMPAPTGRSDRPL